MKQLENIQADKTELAVIKPVKKDILLGKIRPQKGHTCYELNVITGAFNVATFDNEAVEFTKAIKGDLSRKKKLTMKPDCLYATALNVKNAQKVFARMLNKAVGENVMPTKY